MLVSCLGRSIEPLKSFLIHCQNESERGMKFTNIYVAEPGAHITADYYSHIQKPSRALHTVDLPRKDFDDILSDAEDYFDPETKSYYRENGRPHRRGYLFYGPPGTGKTSLSVALASHFDLPLYVLNLNEQGLDDNGLLTRFGHLPERCVVLLEDIDSAGISRTSMKDEDEVTLSGLLNAIDGPAAPEGRLLIMTTNAPKSLDEALYRDGRVDKVVYLGYCTKETAAITFRRIFWTDPRAKGRFTQAEITTMAKDFGRQMPKDTFTPAQIQNFCMDRRGKPHRAISEFEAYKLGRLTGANQFKYDLAEKLDNGEEATKLEDV
ncbi:P-loop containing nucleoside triphosphate hydrolase protein, partial [Lophium mytilinum]